MERASPCARSHCEQQGPDCMVHMEHGEDCAPLLDGLRESLHGAEARVRNLRRGGLDLRPRFSLLVPQHSVAPGPGPEPLVCQRLERRGVQDILCRPVPPLPDLLLPRPGLPPAAPRLAGAQGDVARGAHDGLGLLDAHCVQARRQGVCGPRSFTQPPCWQPWLLNRSHKSGQAVRGDGICRYSRHVPLGKSLPAIRRCFVPSKLHL
mmetsp:Transcript_64237/g.180814  ORF Transcript_64237/g.180814 Transcript_64237/m.180814 type:complete len:207 (+) Transcript_64237:210-830(+)